MSGNHNVLGSHSFLGLNTSCQHILESHLNVLGIYNLNMYSFTRNMPALYHDLKAVKKSCFGPLDRIVFTLFDHDFYLDNQGPGWTLYNLQIILQQLDISNFFCLLLTNQPDYDQYTKYVQQQLTCDDFPIRSITTLLNLDWFPEKKDSAKPRLPQIEKIEKTYSVLSRQARPHRTFFISKLLNENLFDHGIVGYNNTVKDDTLIGVTSTTGNDKNFFDFSLLEIPKHQPHLILKNKKNKMIYIDFATHYKQYKNFNEDVDLDDKIQSCKFDNPNPISKGFLYVGLETQAQLCKPFTTRISLRGIVERRPFVIFGCVGTLKFLQDIGFKTFNEFWDESYDQINNVEDRVDNIIDIVKKLSLLSLPELKNLYREMQAVIDYNHNFYHHELLAQEKKYLQDNIAKNIKGNNY